MKILLDTHIFLWYLSDDPHLPAQSLAAIQDPTNEVYLSVASIWEAVVKYRIGKLSLPGPPEMFLPTERQAHGIASLVIDEGAMTHLANLPLLHRDPFDRILIAQALQNGLTIATVDSEIVSYPVPCM